MITTTSPITSITDELLAELERLAGKAGAMALDSADTVDAANGAMIECPVCGGEGYASLGNDYCNFDNHAIGVQFYGIGPEFGLAEAYFRAANPATILALLQHVRELKADADRYRFIRDEAQWIEDVPTCISWKTNGDPQEILSEDELDEAIDAAMAAKPEDNQ